MSKGIKVHPSYREDPLLFDALTAVTAGKDAWYVIEGEDRIIFSRCEIASVPEGAKSAYRRRVLEAPDLCE